MTTATKVYKVIKQAYGNDWGVSATTTGAAQVVYARDRWTTPNLEGSKLMAFDSYANALKFVGTTSAGSYDPIGLRVWVAEAVGATPAEYVVDYSSYFIDLDSWWKRYNERQEMWRISMPPPDGTVFCDQIMLLERAPRPVVEEGVSLSHTIKGD